MTDGLPAWRDTRTKRAIEAFVAAATREGDPGYIPPAERIAVFDNDGTLWTEKPMPVQRRTRRSPRSAPEPLPPLDVR
jgi:hypothetical protein